MLGNISNFPPVNFLLVSQRTPVSTHYRWGALTLTLNHFGFLPQMFLKHWNLWVEIFHSKEHVAVLCQYTQERDSCGNNWIMAYCKTPQSSPQKHFKTSALLQDLEHCIFCIAGSRSSILFLCLCAACREWGQQSDLIIPAPYSSFTASLMSRNIPTVEIISAGS